MFHLDLLKRKAVANAHARPSTEWHPGAHLGRSPLLVQPPAALLADTVESLGTAIDCVLLIWLSCCVIWELCVQHMASLGIKRRRDTNSLKEARPLQHWTRCSSEIMGSAPTLQ